MIQRAVRRIAGLIALSCALAGLTVPAAAHAVLEASDPPAGAQLAHAPTRIMLTFDENVETSLGAVRVFDASGALIAGTGPIVHPEGDGTRVSITAPPLARGRYIVVWQVISADSHVVGGGFAFGIGVPAGDPPPLERDPVGAIITTFVHVALIAGVLLAIGLPAGAVALGLAGESAGFIEFAAWFVVMVAAFADIALRADINGGTLAASFATRVGVLRSITVLLAVAGAVSIAGRRRNLIVLVPAGVLIALSLSLAGHPAAGPLPVVGVAADALHLIAAAVWIGLIATGMRVGPSAVVQRITPVATLAVGTIVVTGVVQALRNVGAWRPLLDTAYGIAIDAKVALLLAALAMAWSARRAIARGRFDVRRRLAFEAIIVAAVVVVTAVLVDLPLPREIPAPVAVASATMRVAGADVSITATPVDARHWTLRVTATAGGRAFALSGVDATVSEARRHAGPFAIPFARDPSGAFTGTATLPFAGTWSAFVSARSGDFDENHLTLPLTETSRHS
jgi:copper transport protein